MTEHSTGAHLLLLDVGYTEGASESFLLPVSFAPMDKAKQVMEEFPHAVIAKLRIGQEEGTLFESVCDEAFRQRLFSLIVRREKVRGEVGELAAYPGKILRNWLTDQGLAVPSRVLKVEQHHTSIVYKDAFFLKLYRRLEPGINPGPEIERFLTEKVSFPHVPPFAGVLEWRRPGSEPVAIGRLRSYVPREGDAWTYTLDGVGRYFERVLSRRGQIGQAPDMSVLSRRGQIGQAPDMPPSLLDGGFQVIPTLLQDLIGGVYLEMASLLG